MYFSKIPLTTYNIRGTDEEGTIVVRNILFRVGILNKIKGNIFAYYKMPVPDGERPDTIAEKIYSNPELHWIIFLANDMVNPIHDWPKSYTEFENYIASKYGSVATAQTGTHHYEKVITRENILQNTTDVIRLEIDQDTYDSIADDQDYTAYTTNNSVTVHETISRSAITFYDHERELNEKRRVIKIIKPQYIKQVVSEFEKLTSYDLRRPGYRTFRGG